MLPPEAGAQLLQTHRPVVRPAALLLPEAEYQKADVAKRAASKHPQAMLEHRYKLDQQVRGADRKVEEAPAREMDAEAAAAAAARALAARALPPEPPQNVLHLDTILGSATSDSDIQMVLGDDLDLCGAELL